MKEFASLSEKRDWIDRILIEMHEGDAQAEDVEALRALLSEDREARRLYLKSNQLDFMLGSIKESEEVSMDTPMRLNGISRSHMLSGLIGAGVAACIVIIAWVFTQDNEPSEDAAVRRSEPVANVVAEYEAVYEDGTPSKEKIINEGDVSLSGGIAELVFKNGARVILDGKCGFEIVDPKTVVLNYGRLWAHCPPEAYGFKVLTPGGHQIIDLGTEFGVEVDETGETNVHVFYGLVEVKKDSITQSRKIGTGNALTWSAGSPRAEFVTAKTGKADVSGFVTNGDLNQRRMEYYQAMMRQREDLILYYDFSRLENGNIINQAPGAMQNSLGKANKLIPVTGRFKGSRAVLFDDPEARIDLDLNFNEDQGSFTILMWLNADHLHGALSALMNSNGWKRGATHIHVVRDGSLRVGAKNIGDFQTSVSGLVQPGKWQMIAVIWDSDEREFSFYCDGQKFDATLLRTTGDTLDGIQPDFGECRIGSWDSKERTYIPPAAERVFNGRIDEVMAFGRALTDEELSELYSLGKPGI